MVKGKEDKYISINFHLKQELNEQVGKLCSHRGDKGYYLNLAVEYWLEQQGEKVAKFNDRIKG